MTTSRIHRLSTHLANQIAAGEVVERPAAVLKELIENSLDAGSTNILLEVENGGVDLIKIQDDGVGIHKDDLMLAVSRHATSKINTVEDLKTISSLGFRGEALASILSVSRFAICSKRNNYDQAWQLYTNADPENILCKPVAHPSGTTVEVRDLFFNVPVRRRFLKSKRVECNYIEDIVKRIALSNPEVTIKYIVDKNKKIYLQSAQTKIKHRERVKKLFGRTFIENALYIEQESNGIALRGWIGTPENTRSQSDNQYVYLNGRILRDKLVNHAIRQAYGDVLTTGRFPQYVLYLSVDSSEVDVNVHPTKHEVRFRQSRWVHDFITVTIVKYLFNRKNITIDYNSNQSDSFHDNFKQNNKISFNNKLEVSSKDKSNSSIPQALISDHYLLAKKNNDQYLIDLHYAKVFFAFQRIREDYRSKVTNKIKLLKPYSEILSCKNSDLIDEYKSLLEDLGFVFRRVCSDKIMLEYAPLYCKNADWGCLVQAILSWCSSADKSNIDEQVYTLLEIIALNSFRRIASMYDYREQTLILKDLDNLEYNDCLFQGRKIFKKIDKSDIESVLTSI